MNYEQNYRKLISGQKGGLGAAIFRLLLSGVSIGYSGVVRLRNSLYSKGIFKSHSVNAAVISIGNITVGGTGKTPLVVWLYKYLQEKQINCAILTRGYKTQAKGRATSYNRRATATDEPGILSENCPHAKVMVNPDRLAGATEAIDRFGAKLLIMDDGFQHRRLARDLDIITIDATQPFGYDKIFPAGLLREPVASLKHADTVVITRCDQIPDTELNKLETKLRTINPDMLITRSIHAPVFAQTMDSKQIGIDQLKGKKIFAFCGIGNPEAFLNTIRTLGGELVGSKIYNDHYHYTNACLDDIYGQAEHLGADLVLTTQKDWTKIISNLKSQISDSKFILPFTYLEIEIKFLAGEDKLTNLIENTLAGKISPK
jgi:tetraacyldisaccharide 4'-kinase